MFARLAEEGFQQLPKDLAEDLTAYGMSHGSTLIIEELFNRSRLVASCNRRGQLDVQGVWHTSVYGSLVLKDFGRPPAPVTSSARSAAPQRLPASLFTGDASRRTLTEEQMSDLTKARPEEPWPSLSAAILRSTALQWALAKRADGDWDRMEGAWLSLLAIPGTLILEQSEGRSISSAFGFVGLRTPVGVGGVLGFAPIAKKSVKFVVIGGYQQFRVAEVQLAPPGRNTGSAAVVKCMSLVLGGAKHGLLKFSSLRGFPGMTVQHLRRLVALLKPAVDVKLKRVVGEAQLVQVLLRHILGQEYTDGKLKDAMMARGSPMPGVADELLANTRLFDESLGLYDSESDDDSDIKD